MTSANAIATPALQRELVLSTCIGGVKIQICRVRQGILSKLYVTFTVILTVILPGTVTVLPKIAVSR